MRSLFGLTAIATVAGVPCAQAADVLFQGTLDSICILGLTTPGTLGVDAEGRLSSAAGLPGTVTVLTTGGTRLNVKAPVWTQTPAAYSSGGEVFEYSYLGLSGLGVANVDWTSANSDVALPVLPLSILTVNARAANPSDSWVDGTYQMKVEVTCSAS